jgi:hypothetical protein
MYGQKNIKRPEISAFIRRIKLAISSKCVVENWEGRQYIKPHLYKMETVLQCEYGIFRLKITHATERVSEDIEM